MKKLLILCLLYIVSITVNAQDSGPTKEQTIAYIKGFYSDLKIKGWNEGRMITYSYNYKVTINDTKVSMEWMDSFSGKQEYEFDIRDIEYLYSSVFESNSKDVCENSIGFATVNKKLTIKHIEYGKESFVNNFSISIYRGTKCIEDVYQTQIYKAFNHLRKLSGAPEPLKF